MMSHVTSFPPEVVRDLKTYVYRLIDPRNGETFYIGKGKGNRVFAHASGLKLDQDRDEVSDKIKRILDIQVSGFEVAHVIHRHGMDDATAIEVEAALIDAYPGLTNLVSGHGSGDYGPMHVNQIVEHYQAEVAVLCHKALLLSVNQTALETSLYEAARFAWKIDVAKAERAEIVLAVCQGMIRGAFIADRWLAATAANFPGHPDSPGRFGFVGDEAPQEIRALYVGKRVPDVFRKRGAANPIRYTW